MIDVRRPQKRPFTPPLYPPSLDSGSIKPPPPETGLAGTDSGIQLPPSYCLLRLASGETLFAAEVSATGRGWILCCLMPDWYVARIAKKVKALANGPCIKTPDGIPMAIRVREDHIVWIADVYQLMIDSIWEFNTELWKH